MQVDNDATNIMSEVVAKNTELRFLHAINRSANSEKIDYVYINVEKNGPILAIDFKDKMIHSTFIKSMVDNGFRIKFIDFKVKSIFFEEVQ